jgi:phosphocarrier protein
MSASARSCGERAADEPSAAAEPLVRVFLICNKKGLHARASAKFVQTVEKFDAEVRVTRGNETVGGTSIMGLMMLAAAPGTSITVEATGNEAVAVMEALAALIASRFGEDD